MTATTDLPHDLRSAVRLRLSDPPIREHGLTEAELLDAYSHLAPVDGGEVDCG